MAKPLLNRTEKNIHAIWIGRLPENELDNLKIWVSLNEREIYIWTDLKHILVPFLKKNILEHSKVLLDDSEKDNPLLAAYLQNEFYKGFKTSGLSFNQYAKQFMIDKNWQTAAEIDEWVNSANTSLAEQTAELQTYTTSKVNIKDVSALEDEGFFKDDEKFYQLYLRELEEAHFAVLASDLLRLHILEKEGGIYLDTDLVPLLDFVKLEASDIKLQEFFSKNKFLDIKQDLYNAKYVLINEVMRLIFLNQANEESFKKLKQDMYDHFKLDILIDDVKLLSTYLEKVKWENFLKTPLDSLDIAEKSNFLLGSIIEESQEEYIFFNACLVGKKDSWIVKQIKGSIKKNLQYKYNILSSTEYTNIWHLMNKIIYSDYALNNTSTIGLNGAILESLSSLEFNFNWKDWNTNICSLDSINSLQSNWIKGEKHSINNFEQLKDLAEKHYHELLSLDSEVILKNFAELRNLGLKQFEASSVDKTFSFERLVFKPREQSDESLQGLLDCNSDAVKEYENQEQSAASSSSAVSLIEEKQRESKQLQIEDNIDRGEETYYNTGQNWGSSSESDYLELVEKQLEEQLTIIEESQAATSDQAGDWQSEQVQQVSQSQDPTGMTEYFEGNNA